MKHITIKRAEQSRRRCDHGTDARSSRYREGFRLVSAR